MGKSEVNHPQILPDSGGICMAVDYRNNQFAPGLPPGRSPLHYLGLLRAQRVHILYRGTSLIRNTTLSGSYSTTIPTVLWRGVTFSLSVTRIAKAACAGFGVQDSRV